jgi:hypothetical protein
VLKSLDQFPVDVINVSSRDVKYLSGLLKKDAQAGQSASPPALKRMVSANIIADSTAVAAPRPFLIREVAARPAAGAAAKALRIAFVGLTESSPAPPRGFKITEPVEAARRAVPEARKQADLVIVLVHSRADLAARIARDVAGIDVVICGTGDETTGMFIPPATVGETFVVYTPYETRMIGEIRFYPEAGGRLYPRARFVTLDTVVPDDPGALEMATASRTAESKAISDAKSLLADWMARTNPNVAPSQGGEETASAHFVSSNACAKCHESQYHRWVNSEHARATSPLVSKPFEFTAGCLNCHATGSAERVAAKFQDVQCEQCHGPGSNHVAKPAKGYGRVGNMQALCARCHTPETDADFDLQTAWAKIKH